MKKTTKSFIQYVAMTILFLGIGSTAWAAVLGAGESITFIIDDSSANQSDGWNGGPYFYAWDASNNPLTGNWPGTEIGSKEYVFTEGKTIPSGIIFRSKYDWGGNTGKTSDIKDCNGVAFQANYTYTIKLTGSYSGSGSDRIFAYTITGVAGSSGGGSTGGSVNEPYVISVYKDGWDKLYTFTPVPGSTNYEYEVLVEIPDYTGNPADYKYWVGENNGWKNGQSDNYNLGAKNKADDDYLASCATGTFRAKIYALQENGQHHGEARNYYIHGMTCAEHTAKISLASNVREYDLAEPPTSITLTATADEKSEGKYIWYRSDDEGATYTKITETTTNTYTLTGAAIPTNERNYYKVARKVVDSEDYIEAIAVIYTVQSCGAESKGTNIFRQDFGELTAVKGEGSRSSFSNIVSGYTYQPAPYKINDGYYAVVADPYYCGCGDGKNMSETVTDDCLANGVWFRQLRDHTLMNTGATGPYGGMLMINFNGTGIAYQRELTTLEQKNITKNSILKFSAYFASAAVQSKQDVTFNPINMELKIQFQKTGSSTWVDATTVTSQVKYDEGWQRSEVEWTVDDADGKFRVVINNLGASGDGNDLLIDDVSLDLCTPAFALYFADAQGNQFEELEAKKITETAKVQIKQIDFGSLGTDPCIQVYKRVVNGSTTSYIHISEMTLSNGYYTTNVTPQELFENIPGQVELVAVASAKSGGACDANVRTGVEEGTYTPGKQNNVIFSGNYLTYSLNCGTSALTNYDGTAKVCVSDVDRLEMAKMPKLKLTSNNISEVVYVDIYLNNQPFMQEVQYREQTAGCGYMLLDLDALYYDANAEYYQWPVGTNTIKVKVSERFIDASVCERWANGTVAVQVVKRPQITADLVGKEICKGTSEKLSITASPVSQYQWQTMAPGASDWSNVGTNSNTFDTPTTMANETQYRVLMYNDNTLKCATTSAVATMTTKLCEEMSLGQEVDKSSVCQDDVITYTVTLTNGAAAEATNLSATVVWDSNVLELQQDGLPANFDATTGVWSVGEMQPGTQNLSIKFKVISVPTGDITIQSYISSVNEGTYGSYDRQSKTTMKGESTVTIKSQAVAPTPKRKGEIYAFNTCKGDETYGKTIPYDFLIEDKMDDGSDFDKSNLVWMDKNYNVIDDAEANFSVHTLQDVTLYVYNEPEGYCKSDIVEVRYRVKENTSTPKVNDYIDCVDPEAEEVLLKTRVEKESDYKYLVFTDESGDEVSAFDPSQVGETTYTLVAYKDEIGTCPSESVELLVKVKDYAVAGNIAADGAEICPGADVTLSAATQFDEKQDNVVIRWYSDPNLGAESLLATDDDYDMEKVLTDTYVYVTVETNNYCENQAGDAKEVYVAMKQASPELEIQPKEQLITIGGVPSFTVTPNYVGQAAEYSVWVNGEQVESLADYKPYIDSEYTIVFDGECGTTTDSAMVTVQWPTVFTPYVLDGLNDTFVKDMDPNFHTEIFNRFGMPLLTTDNGWDGYLSDGKLAVPGVYYYVVNLPDGNVKKGTIEVFKK